MIDRTIAFVKDSMERFNSSHDWHHIERVHNSAKKIAECEECDLMVVELSALLHELVDGKYVEVDKAKEDVRIYLSNLELDSVQIEKIMYCILNSSFSKGSEIKFREQAILQDADRLDAIGAIGIARCFYYSGETHVEIHDPNLNLSLRNPEIYRKNRREGKGSPTSVAHFYDKLLHIRDSMITERGRELAEERSEYMKEYLDRFLKEWDGQL